MQKASSHPAGASGQLTQTPEPAQETEGSSDQLPWALEGSAFFPDIPGTHSPEAEGST